MNLTHALTILIQGKNLSGAALTASIKGVEDLTSQVEDAGGALDDLGKGGNIVFRILAKGISGVLKLTALLAAALISLVGGFLTAGMAASKYAAALESTSRAFQGILREDAPAMLRALRENSKFMLTDLRLQEQYVAAYMLTGDVLARRMPEAYLYLSKVALDTHDDLDFLIERLYRSVGRLSTRWMAYIGTVVEMEEAQAHAAKMFDTTTDALTREQVQAGMLDRVLMKLAIRTATLPEILGTTEQMAIALQTAFKNLWGEFGTHFLPIARIVTIVFLKLVAVLDMVISRGGPLYNFLRTFAAIISVLGDALSDFLDQFIEVDNKVFQGLEKLADDTMRVAWDAISWGASIITNLAAGMIQGAATALTAAINWISKMLRSWFAPSSPPKVAAEIDKWGAETMNWFLRGFLLADYDILEGVQSQLESVLSAMVSAGMLVQQEAARVFLDISYDMVEAISDLRDAGLITEQMFARLAEVGGGFGEHLVQLTMLQIDYSKAVERVENATLALERAQVELEDSQKHLYKTTDEYYLLLLTGASYEELVAGRAARNAAQKRRTAAKSTLAAAEVEKKASETAAEGLEDRLELQNRLIDQLTLLLQKQAELADDVAKAARDPRAGKIDEPFELPELIMPEAYVANIDQEFEDLKERIRLKFAELWQGIKDDWEASGAGQALGELKDAVEGLKLWLDENGDLVSDKISSIADPVYQWIEDDVWGRAVEEWEAWKTWWSEDSPVILKAVDLVMEKFNLAEEFNIRLERLGKVVLAIVKIVGFIINLRLKISTAMAELARESVTLLAQAITGDLEAYHETLLGMGETAETVLLEIGQDFYDLADDLGGEAFTGKLDEAGKVVETLFSGMKKPAKETKDKWGEYFPKMTEAVEIHMGKVLPMYTQESIWLGITIPKAGKTLKDSQVDDVWPGITGAVTSSFGSILPSFMQITRWEGITIPLAGTVLQAAMERGWASILLSVNLAWAGMLLDFEEMEVWFLVTLPDALVILEELFEVKMTLIYDYIYKVHEYWGGFANSVKSFWRWLQNRTFVINVDVNVPPEGELGSPLKIHTAWMDFEKYLGHTIFEPRLALTGVSGSMGRAETTHVYIESLRIEGVQDARDLLRQLQEMV